SKAIGFRRRSTESTIPVTLELTKTTLFSGIVRSSLPPTNSNRLLVWVGHPLRNNLLLLTTCGAVLLTSTRSLTFWRLSLRASICFCCSKKKSTTCHNSRCSYRGVFCVKRFYQ